MKTFIHNIQHQYIIDQKGKKTAVVMDIDSFDQFIERLEEYYLGTQAEQVLATEKTFHDFADVREKLVRKKKTDVKNKLVCKKKNGQ